MLLFRQYLVVMTILFTAFLSCPLIAEPLPLTLAEKYIGDIDLADYWVSEKYDGVRAYWDGERFISRNGKIFAVPDWFSHDFPKQSLDGELWVARGKFENTVSIVNRAKPHQGWRQIKYMVFDMPDEEGDFDSRLEKMRSLINSSESAFLFLVKQEKIADEATLQSRLEKITAAGGEGLMLRRAAALYKSGRSSDLLKFKKINDDEAIVLEHIPGAGKYQGMMGSIRVKNSTGQIFKIGSGFSDQIRRQPPAIGSEITFKHQGYYQNGTPRFPVFWRQRDGATLKP